MLVVTSFLRLCGSAQSTQPQTVKDCYLLLPKKYFEAKTERHLMWAGPRPARIIKLTQSGSSSLDCWCGLPAFSSRQIG
jgi:hypothetical protein